MRFILNFLIISMLSIGSALPTENLKICQGDKNSWSNCQTTIFDNNGRKLVTDFFSGLAIWQTITHSDGSIYIGSPGRDGIGSQTHPNGEKYVGNFRKGLQEGDGILYSSWGFKSKQGAWDYLRLINEFHINSEKFPFNNNYFKNKYYDPIIYFEKQFWNFSELKVCAKESDSTVNCKKLIVYKNGDKYNGEFKDGRHHGRGILTQSNETQYVGNFFDGKRSGYGVEYSGKFNTTRQGLWKEDKLIENLNLINKFLPFDKNEFTQNQQSSLSNIENIDDKSYAPLCITITNPVDLCVGIIQYPNGQKYIGEIIGNKRNGNGFLYNSMGSLIEWGIFSNDKYATKGSLPEIRKLEEFTLNAINKHDENIKFFEEELRSLPKNTTWQNKVSFATSYNLRKWLESGIQEFAEIKSPQYPPALNLSQDKWESNKEFEDRVALARTERQKEIDRIQISYKAQVDKRNADIQKQLFFRLEKEKQLPTQKN